MDYKVHKTAIIDKGAKIGTGSRIWQWVHVSAGAQIGSDVSLGQNVFAFFGYIFVTFFLLFVMRE